MQPLIQHIFTQIIDFHIYLSKRMQDWLLTCDEHNTKQQIQKGHLDDICLSPLLTWESSALPSSSKAHPFV